MYLTLSKRFEFSASHRYFTPKWSEQQNRDFYGPAAGSPHGYGNNFTLFTVFHGDIDPNTGMIINVTEIKKEVNKILAARYDHKFLNADTPPFGDIPPTPENIAVAIMDDLKKAFADSPARPVVCHLAESDHTAATVYENGRVERHFTIEFSAARKTRSPHLSDKENRKLFGIATGIHGHGYRLRVTIEGPVDPTYGMIAQPSETEKALDALHDEFDHTYLNEQVAALKDLPTTTEVLSRFIFERLTQSLPVSRVRLQENPYFFAEFNRTGAASMGVLTEIHAAHRLHSPHLSNQQNLDIYDKCNNPAGHGHLYKLETTIGGEIDPRSGTIYLLEKAYEAAGAVAAPWNYRHLDRDTNDFTDKPSTAENMISILWPRLQAALDNRVVRVRLWETPNNRFTIRGSIDNGGSA